MCNAWKERSVKTSAKGANSTDSWLLFTLEITELAIIDEIAPIILINSPTINEIFGQYSPAFDLTIIEDNLDVTWYTLDDGITNVTFTGLTGTINQTLWEYLPAGHVTIVFYAKDLNENIGSKAVTIVKEIEEISGYYLILFIGIIGVSSTLILNKKLKKIKN